MNYLRCLSFVLPIVSLLFILQLHTRGVACTAATNQQQQQQHQQPQQQQQHLQYAGTNHVASVVATQLLKDSHSYAFLQRDDDEEDDEEEEEDDDNDNGEEDGGTDDDASGLSVKAVPCGGGHPWPLGDGGGGVHYAKSYVVVVAFLGLLLLVALFVVRVKSLDLETQCLKRLVDVKARAIVTVKQRKQQQKQKQERKVDSGKPTTAVDRKLKTTHAATQRDSTNLIDVLHRDLDYLKKSVILADIPPVGGRTAALPHDHSSGSQRKDQTTHPGRQEGTGDVRTSMNLPRAARDGDAGASGDESERAGIRRQSRRKGATAAGSGRPSLCHQQHVTSDDPSIVPYTVKWSGQSPAPSIALYSASTSVVTDAMVPPSPKCLSSTPTHYDSSASPTVIQSLTPSSASSFSTSTVATDSCEPTPTERFAFSPSSIHTFRIQSGTLSNASNAKHCTYFRYPDVDNFTPPPPPPPVVAIAAPPEATHPPSPPPVPSPPVSTPPLLLTVTNDGPSPAAVAAVDEFRAEYSACRDRSSRRVRLKSISLDSEGAKKVEENLSSNIPVQELFGMLDDDDEDNDDEDDDDRDDDDDGDDSGHRHATGGEGDDCDAIDKTTGLWRKRRNILNLRLNISEAMQSMQLQDDDYKCNEFYFEYCDFDDNEYEEEEYESDNNGEFRGGTGVRAGEKAPTSHSQQCIVPATPKTPTLSQCRQKASSLDSEKPFHPFLHSSQLPNQSMFVGGTVGGGTGGNTGGVGGPGRIVGTDHHSKRHVLLHHTPTMATGGGSGSGGNGTVGYPRASSLSVPTTPKRVQHHHRLQAHQTHHHLHHHHYHHQQNGGRLYREQYQQYLPDVGITSCGGGSGGKLASTASTGTTTTTPGMCRGEFYLHKLDKCDEHDGSTMVSYAGGRSTSASCSVNSLTVLYGGSSTGDGKAGTGDITPSAASASNTGTGTTKMLNKSRSSILQRRGSNHSLTISLDNYTRGSIDLTSSNYSLSNYKGSYKNLTASSFNLPHTQQQQLQQTSASQQQSTTNAQAQVTGDGQKMMFPPTTAPKGQQSKKNLLQRRGSNTSLTLNLRSSNTNLNRFNSHNSLNIQNTSSTNHNSVRPASKKSLLERRNSNASLTLINGNNRTLSVSNCNLRGSICSLNSLVTHQTQNDTIMLEEDELRDGATGANGTGTGCAHHHHHHHHDPHGPHGHHGHHLHHLHQLHHQQHHQRDEGPAHGGGISGTGDGCTDGDGDPNGGSGVGGDPATGVGKQCLLIPCIQQHSRQRKFLSSDSLHNIIQASHSHHTMCYATSEHQLGTGTGTYGYSCGANESTEHFGSTENFNQRNALHSTNAMFHKPAATATASFNNLSNYDGAGFCCYCGDNVLVGKAGNLSVSNSNIRNISTKPLSPQTTSEDFKIYLANIQFLQSASNVLTATPLKKLQTFFNKSYDQVKETASNGSGGAGDGKSAGLLPTALLPLPPGQSSNGNDGGGGGGEAPEADPYDEEHKKLMVKIHQEFWDLPTNYQEKPLVFGSQSKNRYKTILPNEHSRVILQAEPHSLDEPYINANFIKGPDYTNNCYIATQGPLPNTVYEFWLMAYQNACKAVTASGEDTELSNSGGLQMVEQKMVMLTNFVENGRQKCAAYFPQEVGDCVTFSSNACGGSGSNNPETRAEESDAILAACESILSDAPCDLTHAGNFFLVKNVALRQKNGFTMRKLQIAYCYRGEDDDDGDVLRKQLFNVYHYWFPDWPDHRSPDDINVLLDMSLDILDNVCCREFDGSAIEPSAPVAALPIVHCSAGIGRTGCLIAILNGLRQIRLPLNVVKKDDSGVGACNGPSEADDDRPAARSVKPKARNCIYLPGNNRGQVSVDILGIVCNLRLQRGGMVQNSEQYELIHRALCLYLQKLEAAATTGMH